MTDTTKEYKILTARCKKLRTMGEQALAGVHIEKDEWIQNSEELSKELNELYIKSGDHPTTHQRNILNLGASTIVSMAALLSYMKIISTAHTPKFLQCLLWARKWKVGVQQ